MATQKKSLVSQAEQTQRVESNPGAGLPAHTPDDVFALPEEMRGAILPVAEPVFQRSPYVQFVSTKGKAFGQLLPSIPDLLDGEPVLILPQPYPPRPQRPYRFMTAHLFQHWSICDALGAVLKTTVDYDYIKGITGSNRKAMEPGTGREYVEHLEAVVFVLEGETGITPARCTFKGAKAGAARIAADTQSLINNHPDTWRKMSDAHAAAVGAEKDGRFQFVVTAERKSGTSNTSGFNYIAYNGKVRPSKLAELAVLAAARRDEKFLNTYLECRRAWFERVGQIKGKIVGV